MPGSAAACMVKGNMSEKKSYIAESISSAELIKLLKKFWATAQPGTKERNEIIVGPIDDIVAEHEQFFRTVAMCNSKLNESTVIKCLGRIMRGPADEMDQLASKIVACQKHIYSKAAHLVTGEKYKDATRRIAMICKKAGHGEESPNTVAPPPTMASSSSALHSRSVEKSCAG